MHGKMDSFGLSHLGLKRQANEDQFLIASLSKSMLVHQSSLAVDQHTRLYGGSEGTLLLVADGMGGHRAGKEASAIAVQALERYVLNTMPWFFRLQEGHEEDYREELTAAMATCQHHIETAAAAAPERQGMGTTLTMACVVWPRLYVVHVGDSRGYLFRPPTLEQITTDHTVAQKLVERGALRPAEAEKSRWSHVLWNCLGGGTSELAPEAYKAELELGDTLLLCSDGLTGCVSEQVIADLLGEERPAEDTCRALVDAAIHAGAPDNVTVVVACFRDAAEVALAARQRAAAAGPVEATIVDTAPAAVRT
jgi:protein phosphatase